MKDFYENKVWSFLKRFLIGEGVETTFATFIDRKVATLMLIGLIVNHRIYSRYCEIFKGS